MAKHPAILPGPRALGSPALVVLPARLHGRAHGRAGVRAAPDGACGPQRALLRQRRLERHARGRAGREADLGRCALGASAARGADRCQRRVGRLSRRARDRRASHCHEVRRWVVAVDRRSARRRQRRDSSGGEPQRRRLARARRARDPRALHAAWRCARDADGAGWWPRGVRPGWPAAAGRDVVLGVPCTRAVAAGDRTALVRRAGAPPLARHAGRGRGPIRAPSRRRAA